MNDSSMAEASSRLVLPTPGTVQSVTAIEAGQNSSLSDSQSIIDTSRAFHFPFSQAYTIQLDLMQAVFRSIEDGKVSIFESPTGTGKSLSLICSSLTWLERNEQRAAYGISHRPVHSELSKSARTSTSEGKEKDSREDEEPEWVKAHALEKQRAEAGRSERELRARIARAKQLQARFKRARKDESNASSSAAAGRSLMARVQKQATNSSHSRDRKHRKPVADSEDEFLLDSGDEGSGRPSGSTATGSQMTGELADFLGLERMQQVASAAAGGSKIGGDDGLFLSAEVQALMAQYETSPTGRNPISTFSHSQRGHLSSEMQEMLAMETNPKIFYTSRTHSQLSQFVEELKKTTFGQGGKRLTSPAEKVLERKPSASMPVPSSGVKRSSATAAVRIDLEGDWRQEMEEEQPPVRVIALGSRKQMCINESVEKLGREKGGTEAMNEKCKELLKNRSKGSSDGNAHSKQNSKSKEGQKRCPYAPAFDEGGYEQSLEFRDHAFTQVRDIEELTELGRSLNTCPYFASRIAAKQAQVVTLPYNLLLHPDSRASANLNLRDNVVIIDEAHNLIDTILSTHTVAITLQQVIQANSQINTYIERFSMKLRGSNEMHLKQMRLALAGLEKVCSKWAETTAGKSSAGPSPRTSVKEEIMTASSFVNSIGGSLDQINLAGLERFLKDSQIARKVAGYANRQAEKERLAAVVSGRGDTLHSRNSISSMHAISAFLLSLANADRDGRVLLSMAASTGPVAADGTATTQAPAMVIKYQLLNPARSFESVVAQARSVILAGGTMEPVSDLLTQVFPHVEAERLARLSCGHIIPDSNLMASVVSLGPRKTRLEFKFDNRNDANLLDDLGQLLVNFANLIPDGVVVFFSSYKVLDICQSRWRQTEILTRLGKRKKIFAEPQSASEVDAVLTEYTEAIERPQQGRTGAVLFAVVGAKLSEGINFSDRLARAVLMVGLPFPNAASAEMVERMRFAKELAAGQRKTGASSGVSNVDAGQELYVNMCMKAVNQSIGRAIRHRNDYAALLLVDARFGRASISRKLPAWIRGQVKSDCAFPTVMKDLGTFFKSKATSESTTTTKP